MQTISQTEQIRKYLKSGRKLTQLGAIARFGCLRLGARIHELRHDGEPVCSRLVTRNGKHFAEYYIPKNLKS
jgi:hypothetical protein